MLIKTLEISELKSNWKKSEDMKKKQTVAEEPGEVRMATLITIAADKLDSFPLCHTGCPCMLSLRFCDYVTSTTC